jgi:hypothetical protein
MSAEVAKTLSVRESMLLFCIGSGLDRTKAGINDAAVAHVVVKGLADRDAAGVLTLTDRGRAGFVLPAQPVERETPPTVGVQRLSFPIV